MYYAFVSAISILSVVGTIASGFWVLFKIAKGEGATSKGVVADVSLLISIGSAAGSFLALRGVPEEEFDPSRYMVNLAEKVSRVEGERWQRLLGGWHTINVEFAYIKPPYRAPAISPATPGQELESVVQDFRQTFPQRVLITGDPGAGKTVLAIRLILDILHDRKPEDPIPVLFSLAEWDTRMSLTGFVARMLERSYGIRRDLAQALIEARKILPVLDGLDEMDKSDAAVGTSRAARALVHMNEYQSGATAGRSSSPVDRPSTSDSREPGIAFMTMRRCIFSRSAPTKPGSSWRTRRRTPDGNLFSRRSRPTRPAPSPGPCPLPGASHSRRSATRPPETRETSRLWARNGRSTSTCCADSSRPPSTCTRRADPRVAPPTCTGICRPSPAIWHRPREPPRRSQPSPT
ncbi:NACHT domain-containing protein [Streptomyces sp. DHE7-1]|nr:NACHT domain-containing protein [Streptomyces sp. DHE7-1]